MLDGYQAHAADVRQWIEWALVYDAFRKVSALMYVIFAVGLFALGARYHAAMIKKEPGPGQFAEGYFTMLTIQLVPLTITGFVLQDPYIIGTRLSTLAVVIVVYGMISSRDGTLEAWRYRLWMTFWLSVAILGPMVWLESLRLRTFVHDYQNWIAWLSVVAMIAFVVRGQWVIVKALFRHFGRVTTRSSASACRWCDSWASRCRPSITGSCRPPPPSSSAMTRSSCRDSPAPSGQPASSSGRSWA